MQLITSLAILATAATSVQALGSAIIHNQCSFDVYLWPTDTTRSPTTPLVISAGNSWNETYHPLASGGVSLKLSKTTSNTIITQLEYTVQPYDGTNFVWYDGSNVNCDGAECPFYSNGMYLETSDSSCPTRICTPGEVCTGFYTVFDDDENSLSCDDTADTILYLCATSPSSGGSSPVASVVSAVSSVVAAVVPRSTSTTSVAPTSTSTSVSTSVSTPPASSTSSPVFINEAVVTTFLTVTKGFHHNQPTKRAELHAHARRHQH
jgi:hypothetical protein